MSNKDLGLDRKSMDSEENGRSNEEFRVSLGDDVDSNNEVRARKGDDLNFLDGNIDPDDREESKKTNQISDENVGTERLEDTESTPRGVDSKLSAQKGKIGKLGSGPRKVRVELAYDSMLSTFDEFAASGSSGALGKPLGNGFDVGDMVWGKVKSHPWWPGQIYSEAFASPSVRRSKREGNVLVAFFGDSSYGWFDLAEIVQFDSNFHEKSRQPSSRAFVKAMEEAVHEASRRSALGLACRCRNPYNFRPTDVQGYFAVDVGDYEPGITYSEDMIRKARESFQPMNTIAFIKQLALSPTRTDHGDIQFMKNKATVLAYRKVVYEEFDETYAQAFGHEPERPSCGQAKDMDHVPARAPLSGPLRIAEPLGKGKGSTKPNKAKDLANKDRYLLKKRDEPDELKMGQHPSSAQPVNVEGPSEVTAIDYVLQKKYTKHKVLQKHEQTTEIIEEKIDVMKVNMDVGPETGESSSRTAKVDLLGEQAHHLGTTKAHKETGAKKAKIRKHPVGELSGENSIPPEKKKKRKKEVSSSQNMQVDPSGGESCSAVGNVAAQLDPQEDDDRIATSSTPDSVVTEKTDQMEESTELELPQLLHDLQTLALDHFCHLETSPEITRQVFLRFRSLVFQKSSLASLPLADAESNETPASKPLAAESVKELQSFKLTKLVVGPDDPKKGGQKRGPSDRQEEIVTKKKKKISNIKLLMTAGKKAGPKTPVKDTSVPTKKLGKPEPVKKSEPGPSRAQDPTMLVMKFPPQGTLPSLMELKARFIRFGQMDIPATRVFWKSSTCRVVFLHKANAQSAYKFAVTSSNLFGNTGVRCYLRELELESGKDQRAESSMGTSVERRPAVPLAPQNLQQSGVQLKSILKKSTGDETGSSGGGRGGNGGGKGTPRVKFMLGGEEETSKEGYQLMSGNENFKNGASSSTMDFNSKNFRKVIPPPSTLPPILPHSTTTTTSTSAVQFARPPPNNSHYSEIAPINNAQKSNVPTATTPMISSVPNLDTQKMMRLMISCKDVVTNLAGFLGYEPYHAL